MMSYSSNLKEIFQNLIMMANEGEVENLDQFVHNDVSMLTIDIATGDLVEVKGRVSVFQMFFRSLSPPNDLLFEFDKIIGENESLCLLGYFKGTAMQTRMGLIKQDEPFKFRVTVYVEFEQKKVKRIEYYYDTFEVMRLCGTALLLEDDKTKIKNYLNVLIHLGLLSKDSVRI